MNSDTYNHHQPQPEYRKVPSSPQMPLALPLCSSYTLPASNSWQSTPLSSICCSVFESVAQVDSYSRCSLLRLPAFTQQRLNGYNRWSVRIYSGSMLPSPPDSKGTPAVPSNRTGKVQHTRYLVAGTERKAGRVHIAARTLQGTLLKRNQVQPITVHKRTTHCRK